MNERIQQLIEQCTIDIETFDAEKFAELLIQECVDVLTDVLPAVVPDAVDGIHPAWHIKEHFGVA